MSNALNGGVLRNGCESQWDLKECQVFGTNDNPNGPCRVMVRAKRLRSKLIGIGANGKDPYRKWTPAQAAFAHEFGFLPLSECTEDPPGVQTLVIAHSCGRNDCTVVPHMDVVPHKDNLMHCRCHDDINVRQQMNRFESSSETFGLGQSCWTRHGGMRCHCNFKKCSK